MKNKILLLFLLSVAGCLSLRAQNASLDKVRDLYAAGQYAAALDRLEKTAPGGANDREAADYYAALCHIRLGSPQAGEKVRIFSEHYPASLHKAELVTDLADDLFARGDYAQAATYYRLTDKFSLGQPQRNDYVFRKAYSLYASGDYDAARGLLYELRDDPQWGADASYAFGHICYSQGETGLALESFLKVKDHPKYADKAPFYLANIYFARKDYAQAIAQGLPLLEKAPQDNAEIGRIVARSYFNLGDYRAALPYLVRYAPTPPQAQDDYQTGFAYYRSGDYAQAVQYLGRLLGDDTAVGQNACFTLGEAYLKIGKNTEALGAFRSAARMDYDPVLQQDAWYNYAVLSYREGNPYEPASKVLAEYLERYPESPLREQISQYLLDSFISCGDYRQALGTIESMGLDSPAAREASATAGFYLAGQLLNDGQYDSALKYYERTARTASDASLRARADFWAAETCLRMGQDEQAARLLTDFRANPAARSTDEYVRLAYQQGYLAEKSGDYSAAAKYFRTYEKTAGLSAGEKADVQLHLADCAFALGQYKQALALYGAVAGSGVPSSDYATYQKALCQGITGDYSAQIASLTAFLKDFPDSPWRAAARYQTGIAYQKTRRPAQAIEAFLSVEKEPAAGELLPDALSKAALTYYNQGQSDRALELYQRVGEKFPSSSVTPSALRSVRQILVEQGRSDEYVAWSQRTSGTTLDEMAKDSLYFETGQKAFSNGDFPTAATAFSRYLTQYPSGLFVSDAAYYLAESSLRNRDTLTAKTAYRRLLSLPENDFTEGACVKYTELLRAGDSLGTALPHLEKLYRQARLAENRRFAAANLLAVYFQQEDWENVIRCAQEIRREFASDAPLYAQASGALYAALVEEEHDQQAAELTESVKRVVSDENMARTLYYQALLEYRAGDYERSLQTIARLTREYSMYKLIGMRALLLMAQNFCAQGDRYQAEYILNNLVENAPQEDIRQQARVLKQFMEDHPAARTSGETSREQTTDDTK